MHSDFTIPESSSYIGGAESAEYTVFDVITSPKAMLVTCND